MSTIERLDRALEKLRVEGHDVPGGAGSSAVELNGKLLVLIDGQMVHTDKIYEMAGMLKTP